MEDKIKFKLILFYSTRYGRYKITKVKADGYNPKNPKIIWIFDQDKLHLAERIMDNLNIAASINTEEDSVMKIAS